MKPVSAKAVKELRERTGLGIMECKKALEKSADIEGAIAFLRRNSGLKAAKKAGQIAAEGRIELRYSQQRAMVMEVNSQTDFVARGSEFTNFCGLAAAFAMETGASHLELVREMEAKREQLVQKLGENIQIRRLVWLEEDVDVVGSYCHMNRIGAMVGLRRGNAALAHDLAVHLAAVPALAIYPQDIDKELVAKERALYLDQAKASGKPAAIVEKIVEGRLAKYLAEMSMTEQAYVKDPEKKIKQFLTGRTAIVDFIRLELGEGIEREQASFAAEVAAQLRS